MAVYEIYNFCQQNSLSFLWIYLWNEWYSSEHQILWLKVKCDNKISILKTNIFVKKHQKVLKQDFLYKFFRLRLDLVVFIIMKQVISHQQRKFEQIFVVKQEKADCEKLLKENGKFQQKEQLIMYI